MLKRTILATSILVLATAAYADVPRPDRTPTKAKKAPALDTYLSIQLDRGAGEARLIIPRSQLKALRAELDALDEGSSDTAAALSMGSSSRLQMIVSGVLLSLAIAFGGIWFARQGKASAKASRSAAAAMAIFASGALATIVYGNAGPPAAAREITGKMFTPAMHVFKYGGGKIKLEVSDEATTPKLIVPDPEAKPGECCRRSGHPLLASRALTFSPPGSCWRAPWGRHLSLRSRCSFPSSRFSFSRGRTT